MSSNELVLNWLNNDLKLQPNVIDITKEFSNGYRFAEVLYTLKEISEKEFKVFKNSKDSEEIKNNFEKLKTLLHEKYSLEVRQEEFDDISNYDISKATIILYKIKNSYNKKKINFLNIQTSYNPLTKEEIQNIVRDIMNYENMETTDEIYLEDNNEGDKIENSKNDKYDLRKIGLNENDLISIKSENENNYSEKDSNEQKNDKNKFNASNLNINIDNPNKTSTYNNTNKKILNNLNNTINTNRTSESKKENLMTFNTMETMESNNTGYSKKLLKPIIQNKLNIKFLKTSSNDTKINFPKILPKINLDTNIEFRSSIMNSNVGTLTNFSIFNQKINTITTENALFPPETDFNNDFGITKLRELKTKMIQKKLEDIKKQEEIKSELKIKKIHQYDIDDKYRLDFVNKVNNPLYKFTKFTGINLITHHGSKYNSCIKRINYSKDLKAKNHKYNIDKQIAMIRKIMNKNTELMDLEIKGKKGIIKNTNLSDNNLKPFNKGIFFKTLNKVNKEEFDKFKNDKYNKKKKLFPIIKKVVYSIIDFMEDIYEYQEENEKEIIEVEDFKIFSDLFINDKHVNKSVLDKEALQIKDEENSDENNLKQIDINSLILNEDELCLIQDYIDYIGIWNDEKIMDNELKGHKYEIKKIKSDLPLDYEPTENELEDVTLPSKISDNYTLGNTLLSIIDAKYSNNKEGKMDTIDLIKDNIKEKENISLSKWNYIPYKLSLIGYPLSGRKFIAENLIKRYPNFKVYSIKKIFRDYYIEYKTLTEQIDGNPKYKNLKPNQITQMKEEREKQLIEFNPILSLIQPFIDIIKEEKIKKKLEEEKLKKEKELLELENNKTAKGKKKAAKAQNKNLQISKKNVNIPEKDEFEEENINDDLKRIPNDEILFNLLKYKIESDFPKISKQDSEKEIIDYQTKIIQIMKQIETLQKQKQESAKPNPKDDIAINNLQKELDNMKSNSIKGFILVDYPSNINQSILLENYLTGYVDETQKPKSEKNKIINELSNFLDFKIQPKENNTIKKAGIDFVINIINQEKDVDDRFQSKKYDPVSDKIYTKSDLSDDNKNKQPLDKKILERLVNDVPYLTQETFDFYKEEYNNNISLINSLYNKFGLYVEAESSQDNEIHLMGIDFLEKELKKSFQSIELESTNQNLNEEKKDENDPKKSDEVQSHSISKSKALAKKSEKNIIDMENKMAIYNIEEKNKNKILDFICNNVINWLYKEKDKADKIIFYSQHPEYNTEEENDRIKFDPDLKVNEINNDLGKKTVKVRSNNSSMIMSESRINSIVNKNSNFIIKKLINYNNIYYKSLGKFIYLLNIQKNAIHKRLNLIQRKFRDFLNYKSNKKKVLHIYVSKYNEFFKEKQSFFQSQKAIEEFTKDIEEVNNNLWILINEKERESIKELDSIKNCGFIEKELEKFYENLKELSLLETERFMIMINSIIYLYSFNTKNNNLNKKDENRTLLKLKKMTIKRNSKIYNDLNSINNPNTNPNSNQNEKQIEKENIFNKMNFDKNYIFKNTSSINFDPKEITNSTNSFKYRTNNSFGTNSQKRESKSEIMVNNLISKISKNIEIIFMNSIKLILEYQQTIDKLIKDIKSTSTNTNKKFFNKKTSKFNASNNSSMMTSMYGGSTNSLSEKIIKMLKNEKNRYKYRMCFLKSFAYKYMAIITQTTENIYFNVDQWIVTSVSLQNDSLNMIISLLKKKLNDHEFIDEETEINTIEMDEFEKKIDENEEGAGASEVGLKPIDNSSVGVGRIYNKLNIDYLINDNFIDIKVEEIKNQTQKEEDNFYKRLKNDNIENKKYKIIFLNELDRSINSSINNSFGAGLKNRLKEIDFYFDINKFNEIYKNIKKYEIEENIISKDLFYEVFIKQYFIDKYGENDEKENINFGINNINAIEKIDKTKKTDNKYKSELNESEEEEENENENIHSINENLINHHNNSQHLNAICPALKMLNNKQFNKIYSLYQIPIEHKTSVNEDIQKENKEQKITEENKENKDLDIIVENAENKENIENKIEENKENNKDIIDNKDLKKENIENKESIDNKENKENDIKDNNNDKNENKEEKKIEYDIYLNTSEIFTILPLIGCKIMNLMEEENLLNEFKEKFIRGKFLSKKDFMDYHFWFEPDFEYQNEDIMFQQMLEENNKENNLGLEDENRNKKMNIKEFLFNIWKDEKGDKMDFLQFLSVLKINKYITDLNGFIEQNYYNAIFKNDN